MSSPENHIVDLLTKEYNLVMRNGFRPAIAQAVAIENMRARVEKICLHWQDRSIDENRA